jgi:predicted RNA binding protein YcfA (HicA-like mRNA interferase family)
VIDGMIDDNYLCRSATITFAGRRARPDETSDPETQWVSMLTDAQVRRLRRKRMASKPRMAPGSVTSTRTASDLRLRSSAASAACLCAEAWRRKTTGTLLADKTGQQVDGPDADDIPSTYQPDAATIAPTQKRTKGGESYQRPRPRGRPRAPRRRQRRRRRRRDQREHPPHLAVRDLRPADPRHRAGVAAALASNASAAGFWLECRGVPPLPIISGDECIAVFGSFGYSIARQSGSHVRLVCVGRVPVTVPRHATLKRGTLRAILRTAEISVDDFVRALGRRA